MGTYASPSVGVLLGGYDVTGDSVSLTVKTEQLMEDSMAFADSWPEPQLLGISKAEWSQSGFYNDAANASNAALLAGQSTTAKVHVCWFEGSTIGKHFIGALGALGLDYERVASLSGLHRANAVYRISGQVDEGLIHSALAAKTATGNTQGGASAQDNAASSANGGVGYASVSAYSGFTNVVLKIRHSTDNSTYADLITFTTVTAAPTAERLTVSGTVNRYTACSWTVTGSGSITFMLGFKRNA